MTQCFSGIQCVIDHDNGAVDIIFMDGSQQTIRPPRPPVRQPTGSRCATPETKDQDSTGTEWWVGWPVPIPVFLGLVVLACAVVYIIHKIVK